MPLGAEPLTLSEDERRDGVSYQKIQELLDTTAPTIALRKERFRRHHFARPVSLTKREIKCLNCQDRGIRFLSAMGLFIGQSNASFSYRTGLAQAADAAVLRILASGDYTLPKLTGESARAANGEDTANRGAIVARPPRWSRARRASLLRRQSCLRALSPAAHCLRVRWVAKDHGGTDGRDVKDFC
jgi:hypothetical protein